MGNSQTSVTNDPGKPEPDQPKDQTDQVSDYYYDDATGYEIYDEDDDQDDGSEDPSSRNDEEEKI